MGWTIPEPVAPRPVPSFHPALCNILKPMLSSVRASELSGWNAGTGLPAFIAVAWEMYSQLIWEW